MVQFISDGLKFLFFWKEPGRKFWKFSTTVMEKIVRKKQKRKKKKESVSVCTAYCRAAQFCTCNPDLWCTDHDRLHADPVASTLGTPVCNRFILFWINMSKGWLAIPPPPPKSMAQHFCIKGYNWSNASWRKIFIFARHGDGQKIRASRTTHITCKCNSRILIGTLDRDTCVCPQLTWMNTKSLALLNRCWCLHSTTTTTKKEGKKKKNKVLALPVWIFSFASQ